MIHQIDEIMHPELWAIAKAVMVLEWKEKIHAVPAKLWVKARDQLEALLAPNPVLCENIGHTNFLLKGIAIIPKPETDHG